MKHALKKIAHNAQAVVVDTAEDHVEDLAVDCAWARPVAENAASFRKVRRFIEGCIEQMRYPARPGGD